MFRASRSWRSLCSALWPQHCLAGKESIVDIKGSTVLAGCLLFLAAWAVCGLLIAAALQWTWNITVPALFHGPVIDYPQAIALYFFVSLIVGGIRAIISARSS
jgi:hypothetical protein